MAFSVGKGKGVSTSVPSPGRASNVNRDRSTLLRAPRLKPLKTRMYPKNPPEENPSAISGSAGFGQTGLTGET